MTYDVGNLGPGLRQTQKHGMLNRLMSSQSSPLVVFPTIQIHVHVDKQWRTYINSLPLKKKNHTIILYISKLKDNLNMDTTIGRSVNDLC